MTLPASPSASSVPAEGADEVRVDDLVEDVSIDGMCGVY
ncbi:MAG: mycofactocin precursor MftA [Motilibacteraceae bacterium]